MSIELVLHAKRAFSDILDGVSSKICFARYSSIFNSSSLLWIIILVIAIAIVHAVKKISISLHLGYFQLFSGTRHTVGHPSQREPATV